ncbi:hypothetical protein ACFQ5N_14190 [Lutibacter holmesii]|uniref:DUF304 domain-containing protein n=1 Tax=Lutibacter holmesii TaxID=1137985 RepID=A0ABW3WSG0_9FLAO
MKNIYFDDISILKKNWKKIALLIVSLILILFGTFNDILSNNWNKWIKASGFFMFSVYYLLKVIRKNYVQWNKIGMTIRINSYFREKKVTFVEINSYKFQNNMLTIYQSNKTTKVDLSSIFEADKKRLIQIIKDNIVPNSIKM